MATVECAECKREFELDSGVFCPQCGARYQEEGGSQSTAYTGSSPYTGTATGYEEREVSLEEEVVTNFAMFGVIGGLFWSLIDGIFSLFGGKSK